jgi:hypothetical protein
MEFLKLMPKYSGITPETDVNKINEKLEQYLECIKEYLMPIIKGEMWIDELLKQYNISFPQK